jgi:hypothetical protein
LEPADACGDYQRLQAAQLAFFRSQANGRLDQYNVLLQLESETYAMVQITFAAEIWKVSHGLSVT